MIEADDEDVVNRIAKRLKTDFILAPGNGHAAAVLSRWPIVRTINHALLHEEGPRSLVEVVIKTPAEGELPVFAVHLHPRATEADEDKRLQQLQAVLRLTEPLRTAAAPHLLAGDFNANSPVQEIDLARCKASTQESVQTNGGTLPRRVIQALLDAGYVDTLAAFDANAARTQTTFSTHAPGQRVDYIFAFNLPRVRNAWIERDRLAEFASDHFPVGAELDV
jgi:endonuclease/exonuclease/phosphatase family metal-dependent hydrolase